MLCFMTTLSVIPEFSAAQEKLDVWLIVVIGIAAGVEFLTISVLSRICLSFLKF